MRISTRKWMNFVLMLLCSLAFAASAFAQNMTSNQQPEPVKTDSNTQVSKPHDSVYIIGASDVLAINVWKEPDVSRSIPVRSDGKISLPLVGEIQASGRTPLQLEQEITTKLKTYISEPEVTVMVQESRSQKFNILGMVVKPGSYPLVSSTTMLDALALAGGFRDFAKKKQIYLLRKDTLGQMQRIPFNYNDVISGKNTQENVSLQADDTIVVP